MTKRHWLLLVSTALLWTASSMAVACRIPGKVWPSGLELAATSALVFVAHVDTVQPLDEQDEDVLSGPDAPADLFFRAPTSKAEFTLVSSLKGDVPMEGLLRSSSQDCSGVALQAGRDYLIFADAPRTSGADIEPIKGSYDIGMPVASRDDLHDIETTLSSETNPTTP